MDVSLIQVNDKNNIKQQNDIIQLTTKLQFTSTKNDVRKGKWYYEGTFEEGIGDFIVGFKTQYGLIQFWPRSYLNLCIWLNDAFVNSDNCETVNITIPSTEKYVFGIGIDIESNIFYIVHNNIAQTYQFRQQKQDSKYNTILRGTVGESVNEKVRINFGKEPFIYSIGFRAWNQPEIFQTPIIKNKIDITILYIIVIII